VHLISIYWLHLISNIFNFVDALKNIADVIRHIFGDFSF